MKSLLIRNSQIVFVSAFIISLIFISSPCFGQVKSDSTEQVVLPEKIITALETKFPKAKINKITREEEDGKIIYDIEFEQDSIKFEADFYEDGSVHNWEKEINSKDLPPEVLKVIKKKYPKYTIREVMAITEVKGNTEILEGYEIVFKADNHEEIEVTFAPDGLILESPEDSQ